MTRLMQALAGLCIVASLAFPLNAQNYGTITGTVTDASGAVVTGATVTVTNSATNQVRTVQTNEAGNYNVPFLVPGEYGVRVELTGFRAASRPSVNLQVGAIPKVDFSLQVGEVSETVEVTADIPNLDTQTTTIGTVIENRSIEELPLNGRNYLQLTSLVPGTTTYSPPIGVGQQRMGGARNEFVLNVAGARTEFNHYMLDGVVNTDPNYGTYLAQPSVDALQEFKMESGTFSAEYGHGIAQVNVITKSGTNELHGAVFEFLRNAKLDAKNFFDNPNTGVPPFKRNQFGFVVGGPIVRDKLFFLGNYEGLRQRKALTTQSTVPYERDKTGDFSHLSQTVYDINTRVRLADGTYAQDAFPNNRIPDNRIHLIARETLALYPSANQASTAWANNFLSNEAERIDADQYLGRIDWAQTANSNWHGRYNYGTEPQYRPANFPGYGTVNDTTTHQVMVGNTLAIGSTMVNEFKFGMSDLLSNNGNLHQDLEEFNVVERWNIQGPDRIPLFYGYPTFNISRFGSFGDPANGPYVTDNTIFQFTDNFSWTKGNHNFKFGGEFRRTHFNIAGNDVARGRFSFTGVYSQRVGQTALEAHSLADFMLGLMSNSEGQTGFVVSNLRNYHMALYFQDQWKVTPKLTINYGLRYELEPGFHDTLDRLTVLDFRWDNSIVPTFVRAGTGDVLEGNPPYPLPPSIPSVRDGRFGRNTYRTDKNDFGPRAGIAYTLNDKTVIRAGGGIYYVHDIGNALFDSMRNPPFTVRRAESANTVFPDHSWNNVFISAAGAPTLTPVFQWEEPTTYISQWSFGIQRGLTENVSLETTYVGSSGVHLERTTLYNAAPPGPPGNPNARRPFPVLGNVQLVARPSNSNYHSLQARLRQRLSKGLSVLSSFTWGKSLDSGSGVRTPNGDSYTPPDPLDLSNMRARSQFDFSRRLTTSFLWELPFRADNRFANALFGGWQLGGIITFQDGFPFNATTANAPFQNNTTTTYPDATGIDPELPGDQRTLLRWFNTDAWVSRLDFVANVGPYRYGNAGRNGGTGPGIIGVDASVNKNFQITEGTRLEFRTEFFNLPNHPVFDNPNANVTGGAAYGRISATRLESRQIQFGLKLLF